MYANSKELARRIFGQLYVDTYWDKLVRISRASRHLVRIDRRSAHETTYVLAMLPDDGPIYLPVVCRTLSMMEVLNENNPSCFSCDRTGKNRGLIHVVE